MTIILRPFHARFGEFEAQIAIGTSEVLHGSLPRRALALIREWVVLHRGELAADWERAQLGQPLAIIDPLP